MMKVLKIILPILFVISSCTGLFNDRILNRYQNNASNHDKNIEGVWLHYIEDDPQSIIVYEFEENGRGGLAKSSTAVLHPDTGELLHYCDPVHYGYYYTEGDSILYQLNAIGGSPGYKHLETIVNYRIDNDTLYCEKIEGSNKVYIREGDILIKYRDNAETH